MSAPVALAVTVALLAGNAFFVGAEFAVTSSRRSQLEPLAEAGDARAATALWALRHISRMLATAQLGVTVCSTGLGVVAEPAIAHALTPLLISLGIGRGGAHPVAVVIALVLVVYVHVVAGEMVPKNMSISAPEKAVRLLAPPQGRVSRGVGPRHTRRKRVANPGRRSRPPSTPPRSPRSSSAPPPRASWRMTRVCSPVPWSSPRRPRAASWCPWMR